MWDIARIFEAHAEISQPDNDWAMAKYEEGLQQVVEATLLEYTLADFVSASPLVLQEGVGRVDGLNRFKFKPMVPAWLPKAPNSVFQLHMHS